MRDIDDPVKNFNSGRRFDLAKAPNKRVTTFQLAKNEFENDNGRIGFLREEVEPLEFLTVDSESSSIENHSADTYAHFRLELAENMHFSERKSYTFFVLLGDVGGFNAAIIILPFFLISRYNEIMYNAAIKSEIPINKLPKKKQE